MLAPSSLLVNTSKNLKFLDEILYNLTERILETLSVEN